MIDEQKIKLTLKGELSPNNLTGKEQEIYFDLYSKSLQEWTPEQKKAFHKYIKDH